MFLKKPPDPYKCVKIPLNLILDNKDHFSIINDAVVRTNKIVIKSYQLLRLWILKHYSNNGFIPKINTKTITTIFQVINNNSYTNDSQLFKDFHSLFTFDKENGSQLTQVLYQYAATEILTGFENNIKLRFFDYVKRFVNSHWSKVYSKQLENKELDKKIFNKEMFSLKTDLFLNTTDCDPKYHSWLNENRFKIMPDVVHKNGYYYDIQIDSQKYLTHMIWMNAQLENQGGGNMFQFSPLRTSLIPCFMHLDNTTLIKLLVKDRSIARKYIKDITGQKTELWQKYFNMKYIHNIKQKNYTFDFAFTTDGLTASLRFIHIDELYKQTMTQQRIREGRKTTKGMTKEERSQRNKEKSAKETNTKKTKQSTSSKNETKVDEFQYINNVDINLLKNKNYIVVDPGKRDLMTMMDQNGERLTYSNKQRIKETKRFKYQRIIKNYRDDLGLTDIEEQLKNINSKTCDIIKFKEYLNLKNKVNNECFKSYEEKKFRQYRWYAHIETNRANANMLNLIEKKYGKDINIIYGDWSQDQQMRYFLSTPNLGIKRKLRERYNVYNIDEYNTSKLHHKTEKECKKLSIPDKTGVKREKHAVLTYKMENQRLGCINRDNNACLNLRKLYKHFLKTNGTWLKNYTRPIKQEKPDPTKKGHNHITQPSLRGGKLSNVSTLPRSTKREIKVI